MGRLLNFIARILNYIPEFFARFFCCFCGYLLYILFIPRRHIVLKNLHTVFPDKSERWYRKLARVNCCRWAETVWLFLIGSVWDKEKIRQRFSVSPALRDWMATFDQRRKSAVVLVPHLNLMETMTWIPALFEHFPDTGVVYRPFRSKWFENWIRATRERFGLQLISRKRGVMPLEKILKNNGIIGILFDQSAGEPGCLTTFFKRLASCTDLPGRLVEKYGSDVVAIYLKRTGFLQGELCLEEIACQKETLSVTLEANRWLAAHLETDPAFYENWLWLHRRWKIQHWPLRRFNIFQKRNLLDETCDYFNWTQLPRKTEAWIRMPDNLSDVIAVLPLLEALRKARPDFCLHLLSPKDFAPWLQRHTPVDLIHTLPCRKGWGYFKHFFAIRKSYPDVWINFSDTFRSDLEAYLSGAEQRFGIRKRRWRFLLNHVFEVSAHSQEDLTTVGYKFLQAFGLKEPLEYPRISKKNTNGIKTFGCIINVHKYKSESAFWKHLMGLALEKFPEADCVLWEDSKYRLLDVEILLDLPKNRIKLLKDPTLLQTETVLKTLDFVITDDQDIAHLCNYLGILTFSLCGDKFCKAARPELKNVRCIRTTMQNNSADSVFAQIVGAL